MTKWMCDKKEVSRVIKTNKTIYRRWWRITRNEIVHRIDEAFKQNKEPRSIRGDER